jgi:hypothetical protein
MQSPGMGNWLESESQARRTLTSRRWEATVPITALGTSAALTSEFVTTSEPTLRPVDVDAGS